MMSVLKGCDDDGNDSDDVPAFDSDDCASLMLSPVVLARD